MSKFSLIQKTRRNLKRYIPSCPLCSIKLVSYNHIFICPKCCIENSGTQIDDGTDKDDGSNVNANYGYWGEKNQTVGISGGYGSVSNSIKFLNKWHKDSKEKKVQNAHYEFNILSKEFDFSQKTMDLACEYFIEVHRMKEEKNKAIISRSSPRFHIQLACIYLALNTDIITSVDNFYKLIIPHTKRTIIMTRFEEKLDWVRKQLNKSSSGALMKIDEGWKSK